MIYRSERFVWNSVREVFHGTVNDVLICEELRQNKGEYYTLLLIREHAVAKRLLEILEKAKQEGRDAGAEIFSDYGNLCLAFEYQQERPISQFCIGQRCSRQEGEQICLRLILECMSSRLPWPILYLILTQNQIHMRKDGAVYFSYQLDFSGLDENRGEKECAACAGDFVREVLQDCAGWDTAGCRLLQKRLATGSYRRLIDLYQDVKLTQAPAVKTKPLWRIRTCWRQNRDRLFPLLFVFCVVFGILALAMLAAQIIWGEIPFLRIFANSFEVIGTQSLLQ